MDKVPLDDQIAEVNREIKIREGYYKRMIKLQRMSQSVCDERMTRMQGVLATLTEVKDHKP